MYKNQSIRKKHSVAKAAEIAKYHDTFEALLDKVPEEIYQKLSGKEIAQLIDIMYAQHEMGYQKGVKEMM